MRAGLHAAGAATAQPSTFAGIVRLVRAAGQDRPPLVRLADRGHCGSCSFTLCGGLAPGGSRRDPVRALAVLVVATPCPLILAAPVAFVCGISRSPGADHRQGRRRAGTACADADRSVRQDRHPDCGPPHSPAWSRSRGFARTMCCASPHRWSRRRSIQRHCRWWPPPEPPISRSPYRRKSRKFRVAA